MSNPNPRAISVASNRSRAPKRLSTELTCVFTVSMPTFKFPAISGFDCPCSNQWRTSVSRDVRSGKLDTFGKEVAVAW